MLFFSLPDNNGDKQYCTHLNQKILAYDFQN